MTNKEKTDSQLKNIMSMFEGYPVWLKEVLYLSLRDELKNQVNMTELNAITSKDSVFLYEPKLTRGGLSFLENLKYSKEKIDKRLVEFLKAVKKQKNMVDIAQDNEWTLKAVCFYVIKAWEKNIIQPTYSKKIYALVRLLSGEIDIGEYLMRIDKIPTEQYHWIKKMNQSGMVQSLGEEAGTLEDTIVNMGFASPQEIHNLKELIELASAPTIVQDPVDRLQKTIADLAQQLHQQENTNNNLLEEMEALKAKIAQLNQEVELRRNERDQYHKELGMLKIELKKALKG